MASGGYRQPAHPAAVSGPGAFSRRTDSGQPGQVISTAPGQAYGDAKQQALQQQTAPMAGTPPLPTGDVTTAQEQPQPIPQPQPFTGAGLADPSSRPGEPVTHGVNVGAGAGTDALQLGPYGRGQPGASAAPANGSMTRLLSQLSGTDTTGILADLLQSAAAQGA